MKGKTLLSLMLCLLLVVSLARPVFAEEEKKSDITILSEENDGAKTDSEKTQTPENPGKPEDPKDEENPKGEEDPKDEENPKGEEDPKDEGDPKDPENPGEGEEKPSEKPKCKHEWVIESSVPASCTKEGTNNLVCKLCGDKQTDIIPKRSHKYDNACDPDCNVCGATRDASHKPGKAWSKNASGHWHVCSVCGENVEMGDHYPGPAATEDKDQICLTCGYVMTRALGHVHKYETEYTSDETGHWYACTGCNEKKDFQEHVFDNACDPDCNICGYETKNAHDYGDTLQYDAEAHWGVCVLCGQEGEHFAHVPGDEATEDKSQICVVCGMELAPPLNHTHQGENWVSNEDSHQYLCSCGKVMEEGSHTWDAGRENPDGTMTYTCTQCVAQRTEGEPKAAEAEFPWILVIGVAALVCAVGAAVSLIVILAKKPAGKFSK